jgi:branched-subunit amino acid aminotransferase/4-amino-4-deoxychorismate lyase
MIWLNGNLRRPEGAFSANDRGLLLGEAVFETILLKNGVAQFWDEHWARLMASCAYAGLDTPYSSPRLQQALADLSKEHLAEERQVLRITVTGGEGGRGLIPSQKIPPHWMLQLSPAPHSVALWHLVDVPFVRDAHHVAHKTTAYLENILIRRAALEAGGDEAILFNAHGDVACAAAGNLFIGYNNRILTPRLQDGALPGIMRQQILTLESIRVDGQRWQIGEAAISRETANEAQFILLTNSVMEVAACAYNPPETRGTSKQQAQKMAAHLNDALPYFNA